MKTLLEECIELTAELKISLKAVKNKNGVLSYQLRDYKTNRHYSAKNLYELSSILKKLVLSDKIKDSVRTINNLLGTRTSMVKTFSLLDLSDIEHSLYASESYIRMRKEESENRESSRRGS